MQSRIETKATGNSCQKFRRVVQKVIVKYKSVQDYGTRIGLHFILHLAANIGLAILAPLFSNDAEILVDNREWSLELKVILQNGKHV